MRRGNKVLTDAFNQIAAADSLGDLRLGINVMFQDEERLRAKVW